MLKAFVKFTVVQVINLVSQISMYLLRFVEVLRNKVLVSSLEEGITMWANVTLIKAISSSRRDYTMQFAGSEISVTVAMISGTLTISYIIPSKYKAQFKGTTNCLALSHTHKHAHINTHT